MEQKIPKKLHYVWIGGGKKNELMETCIASWKKFCPDYEITEWNESNFDIEGHSWVKKAVSERNWALAADIIRLWAVFNYGGIYLDTDVEITKSFDGFLHHDLFIGYEAKHWLNPATFGAVKGHEALKRCLQRYEGECDKINFSTNPLTVHTYGVVLKSLYGIKMNGKTKILDNGVAVFSVDYLCPMNYMSRKLTATENTCAIHRYTGTWLSSSQKRGARFAYGARKVLGAKIYSLFEKIVAMRFAGMLKRQYKKIDKRNR